MKHRGLFKRIGRISGGHLFSVALFLLVAAVFAGGVKQVSAVRKDEALRVAKEGVMRAVVSCYAVEGRYPESYEYLKTNYGAAIDETKYVVHYAIFASNIMPDIAILER